MKDDTISRQAAIDAICEAFCYAYCDNCEKELDEDLCGDCHRKYQNWSASRKTVEKVINSLPSAQPERLTDDDFETIRIHLSAFKERLCNQHRWKEAEEYQRIIDRFMSFTSAQQKPLKYSGDSICIYCVTGDCDGCMYEPMEGVING